MNDLDVVKTGLCCIDVLVFGTVHRQLAVQSNGDHSGSDILAGVQKAENVKEAQGAWDTRNLLQHEGRSSGRPVAELHPTALWIREAPLDCSAMTKAEDWRCRSSLQDPLLTMDAVPSQRAVAST